MRRRLEGCRYCVPRNTKWRFDVAEEMFIDYFFDVHSIHLHESTHDRCRFCDMSPLRDHILLIRLLMRGVA